MDSMDKMFLTFIGAFLFILLLSIASILHKENKLIDKGYIYVPAHWEVAK